MTNERLADWLADWCWLPVILAVIWGYLWL